VYAERTARFPTLKSELIYAPRSSRMHQPHVFDRGRKQSRQAATSRRESPVLPRSNPFAIPQRSILDSLAPFLRFATLVALFTAVGIWLQAVAFRSTPTPKTNDTPSTTAQEPHNPATKTAERPGESTSAGPVKLTPETNLVMGKPRDAEFATLRGDILPVSETTDDDVVRNPPTNLHTAPPAVARRVPGFNVIPPLPR
jgi:hypothetical protein